MKLPCPHCGAIAIREGASKCPACKQWVGPKPRKFLTKGGVLVTAVAVMAMGAFAGAAGTAVAMWPRRALPSAVAPVVTSTSAASTSASAPPADAPSGSDRAAASSAPAAAPPVAAFGSPRSLKLEFAPVDAVVGDDDATLAVLADDGSVHVLALADGKEIKKVGLAARATELRLLSGGRVALLGGAGPLHVFDLKTGVVQKLDVGGGPVDALEIGDSRVLLVASSTRRLTRFSASFKAEGQVTLARPIVGLSTLAHGDGQVAAVLEQGRRGGPAGAIEFFDPAATPFAGVRNTIPVGFEPRRGALHETGPALLVADKVTAQLSDVSPDHPMRSAGVGRAPVGAYRLGGRWAVTLDASGSAAVSDTRATTLEATKTFALGGPVSDAALSPDGMTLLVALGGGGKERGVTTALVAGDPPVVVAKFTTGAGSHAVSVAASGKLAVVTAYWARTLTVLSAK